MEDMRPQFTFARLVELAKHFQFVALSMQFDMAPSNQRLLLKNVKLVLDHNRSIAPGDTTTGRILLLAIVLHCTYLEHHHAKGFQHE